LEKTKDLEQVRKKTRSDELRIKEVEDYQSDSQMLKGTLLSMVTTIYATNLVTRLIGV